MNKNMFHNIETYFFLCYYFIRKDDMMKKLLLFGTLLVAVVFMSACGNSNSIVGTWNYYKDGNTSTDIYYTFDKGNTGSYTYSGNSRKFKYEDRGTKVVITYDGDTASSEFDYTIDKGILTIKDSFGSDVTYKRK